MQQVFRIAASLAVSAVLLSHAVAQKSTVSDAEVESNVLKAMAADDRLATQTIQTSTAFGTVTLSGSVADEATRDAAEQIAAHVPGVKKVVDQITVKATAAPQRADILDTPTPNEQAGMDALAESDGAPQTGSALPPAAQTARPELPSAGNAPQATTPSQLPTPSYPQPAYPQEAPAYPRQAYPQQAPAYPQQSPGYPQQAYPRQAYPPPAPPTYPYGQAYPQPAPRLYRRDYERQQRGYGAVPYAGYGPQYGQGGQRLTLAPGIVLPVRITSWLSSGDAGPGSTFHAVVEHDILAGGVIAIPRGAEVGGTVVEARGAGVLKGRGSLTLQLDTLHLGGQVIPLQSEPFTVTGHDKAAQSVNSTLGGAAIGAVLGAVIGGGTGAAIGAGVGGAAGLGASAASGGGNAHLPAEALLQFQLTAPVSLITVSETEMQRLGNYAGPEGTRHPAPGYYGYGGPAPYGFPGPYDSPYGAYGRPYGGPYGW